MFVFPEEDRIFLVNKYHKANEPFDPFRRMNYHGYAYDEMTGASDEAIKAGLRELVSGLKDQPHAVIKAEAIAYVLDHTRIDVNEHDYYIGLYSWNRLIDETTVWTWHKEVVEHHIPDVQHYLTRNISAGTFTAWPDYDHSVPDWQALFSLGFRGVLERARASKKAHAKMHPLTPLQEAYFTSIDITYEAVLRFLDRLIRYTETKRHARAGVTAACLRRLRDGAPQHTYDVLQLIYIYFMVSESVDHFQVRSLASGLDTALTPYYQKDLESGAFTKEELNTFIAYFLMQFSAIGNYWGHPFYMGGTDEQGNSLINELTYTILEIYEKLGIYNPKIQLKINKNTSDEFLNKVLDMIRRGHNSIVFVCEPGLVRSMMSLGLTYDEARTCDIKGCYEFAVRAHEVSTAPLYLNLLKPVCLVFNNGVDTMTGERVGMETGPLEGLTSFSTFHQAYMRQLAYILDHSMQAIDQLEGYLDYVNPSPLFSATIEHSLQTMKDAYANGSKYNNTAVLHTGFASAVDALMSVKHLVYDTGTVTLQDMKQALRRDWQGYEWLRAKALRCPYKFGNNDQETDLYATALSRWLCMKENLRPNARGGIYKAAMHSARKYIDFGKITEATPDGRKAGDELSKNISPVMGMDTKGVTALIHSAVKVDPSLYTENYNLDVMLHPSAVSGEDGLTAMRGVLRTYIDHHGLAIQFNVLDSQTLRDAQVHPERYQNLQVRVCGWNVLFVHMSKAEQDAFILRSENVAQ